MVSGSDAHGTPITLRAEAEGVSPREIHDRFHQGFLESWGGLGISWDLYTTTETENHYRIAQDFFRRFYEKGLLYETVERGSVQPVRRSATCRTAISTASAPTATMTARAATSATSAGARSIPRELIDPRSSLDGGIAGVPRAATHFMMKFSEYGDSLSGMAQGQDPLAPAGPELHDRLPGTGPQGPCLHPRP